MEKILEEAIKTFKKFETGLREMCEISYSIAKSLNYWEYFLPADIKDDIEAGEESKWRDRCCEFAAIQQLAKNAFQCSEGYAGRDSQLAFRHDARSADYTTTGGLGYGWVWDRDRGYEFYISHPEGFFPKGSTLLKSAKIYGWEIRREKLKGKLAGAVIYPRAVGETYYHFDKNGKLTERKEMGNTTDAARLVFGNYFHEAFPELESLQNGINNVLTLLYDEDETCYKKRFSWDSNTFCYFDEEGKTWYGSESSTPQRFATMDSAKFASKVVSEIYKTAQKKLHVNAIIKGE